jgi:hypothetical protein
MRGRLVTIAAWLVIIGCAFIVAARVHAHYSAPPVAPAVWTPPPLVPNASATASSTAAASSAAPVSTNLGPGSPLPTGTVTTWVTVTAGAGG